MLILNKTANRALLISSCGYNVLISVARKSGSHPVFESFPCTCPTVWYMQPFN